MTRIHSLRTLLTEAWREWSSWIGAAVIAVLVLFGTSEQLGEWKARIDAASGVLGAALIAWRQNRGQG